MRRRSAPVGQKTRQGLQAAVLGQDSACHHRFRSEASDWNLGFRGGRYTRARKARRWSRAKVKWEMSDYLHREKADYSIQDKGAKRRSSRPSELCKTSTLRLALDAEAIP